MHMLSRNSSPWMIPLWVMTHGWNLVIRGNKSTDQQSCAGTNRLLTLRRWPCRLKKNIIGIQPDTYSPEVHLSNQDPKIHRSYGSDPGPDLDVTILVWVLIHTMASHGCKMATLLHCVCVPTLHSLHIQATQCKYFSVCCRTLQSMHMLAQIISRCSVGGDPQDLWMDGSNQPHDAHDL